MPPAPPAPPIAIPPAMEKVPGELMIAATDTDAAPPFPPFPPAPCDPINELPPLPPLPPVPPVAVAKSLALVDIELI